MGYKDVGWWACGKWACGKRGEMEGSWKVRGGACFVRCGFLGRNITYLDAIGLDGYETVYYRDVSLDPNTQCPSHHSRVLQRDTHVCSVDMIGSEVLFSPPNILQD